MSWSLLSALLYTLGFVGLASVGLLPLRSWQVLRGVFLRGLQPTRKVLATFTVLVVVAALLGDVQITMRIFRCLTETYCGPSVASGWIYLAMLGVVYLAFEAVIIVLQRVERANKRRGSHSAEILPRG